MACIIGLILGLIVFTVGPFFGFIPNFKRGAGEWNQYERYGEHNEKRYIAPWKIVGVIIIVSIFLAPEQTLTSIRIYSTIAVNILSNKIFWTGVGVLTALTLMITAICKIRKTESWTATRERIKGIKSKACPLVEIVKE